MCWPQLSMEVSSNDRYAISVVCGVFPACSVHFFDVVVRVSRVGEVHTHQFDALVVDHDCRSDGPFAYVLGVDDFLSTFRVQHNANNCSMTNDQILHPNYELHATNCEELNDHIQHQKK